MKALRFGKAVGVTVALLFITSSPSLAHGKGSHGGWTNTTKWQVAEPCSMMTLTAMGATTGLDGKRSEDMISSHLRTCVITGDANQIHAFTALPGAEIELAGGAIELTGRRVSRFGRVVRVKKTRDGGVLVWTKAEHGVRVGALATNIEQTDVDALVDLFAGTMAIEPRRR
jgi:hypothetical protein